MTEALSKRALTFQVRAFKTKKAVFSQKMILYSNFEHSISKEKTHDLATFF